MLTKELTSKTMSFAKGANYVGETWYGKKHGEGGARHGALNKRGARSGPCAAMSPRPPRPPRELPLLAGSRLKNASIKDRNRVFNEQELFSFIHISKAGGSTFERCNSTKKLYRAGQLYANFTMPHFVGPTDGDLIIRARSRRTIMGCRIAANGMVSCPRAYADEAYTIEFAYAFDGHFEALKLHPPQCAPRGQVEILTQENGTNVPLQLSNVRPLPPLCAPSQIPSTTGSWYDAEWIPTNCRIRYTKTKSDRRVLLVGDSHQRVLENYLQSLDVNASYIGSTGIMNRNFTNFTKNCTQTLSPGTDDAGLYRSALTLGHGHDVVVFESGHWDMRDTSVEVYKAEFARLVHETPFCNLGRTVVWRTAPAYSYKRYEFLEQKEYRTNAKLERIAAITTAYLARYCPHVRILDSFRITLPMFEHSCDTHHYLCWRNSTKEFVGADRASAHVLLQLI